MSHKKVFIVDYNSYSEYHRMFLQHKWEVVHKLKDADLIQFTGGADVNPALYNQEIHPKTIINLERDRKEVMLFHIALAYKIPMAGICRGGQFLNVMCGGSMWQHVNNHTRSGMHEIWDYINGDAFSGTSTHHQEMIPGKNGEVLGVAYEATIKEAMKKSQTISQRVFSKHDPNGDVEIVWYEKNKCFCFQPHPEFMGAKELADRYFDYIYQYCMK